MKSFGITFNLQHDTFRRLSGSVQELDSKDVRFVGVGACVRTPNAPRHPGILLCRSWSGQVPGVGYTTVTENTANDTKLTSCLLYDPTEINVVSVVRNLYHIHDLNAFAPEAMWNSLCVKCSHHNDGCSVKFTLYLPLWSVGAEFDHGRLQNTVHAAFEGMESS